MILPREESGDAEPFEGLAGFIQPPRLLALVRANQREHCATEKACCHHSEFTELNCRGWPLKGTKLGSCHHLEAPQNTRPGEKSQTQRSHLTESAMYTKHPETWVVVIRGWR